FLTFSWAAPFKRFDHAAQLIPPDEQTRLASRFHFIAGPAAATAHAMPAPARHWRSSGSPAPVGRAGPGTARRASAADFVETAPAHSRSTPPRRARSQTR